MANKITKQEMVMKIQQSENQVPVFKTYYRLVDENGVVKGYETLDGKKLKNTDLVSKVYRQAELKQPTTFNPEQAEDIEDEE